MLETGLAQIASHFFLQPLEPTADIDRRSRLQPLREKHRKTCVTCPRVPLLTFITLNRTPLLEFYVWKRMVQLGLHCFIMAASQAISQENV